MMRVTLNGIHRVGLVNWEGRERWGGYDVRIWSAEHLAWWRPKAKGYTHDEIEAGIFPFPEAYDYTKHCGPEKRIAFYRVAHDRSTTP